MTKDNMKTIVILTLLKHQDGVWITRLVQYLESIKSTEKYHHVIIEVRALETWLEEGVIVSSPSCDNIAAFVNRVSDAASPSLYKATLAILGIAQSRGIPIVNGPQSFALCGNKWCHHALFTQSHLQSPATLAFWNSNDGEVSIQCIQEKIKSMDLEDGCTLLAKPNAGGFGVGIMKLTLPIQSCIPVYEDCVTLLQKYELPRNYILYRVWFLQGKVQCAIERDVQDNSDQFTNACSGSCSIQQPPKAWKVPPDVKQDLEEKLLPKLPDAHCGSIEFFYSQDSKKLYFDLNLLSTLPLGVSNEDGVWDKDYDPWMEMAQSIWKMVYNTSQHH